MKLIFNMPFPTLNEYINDERANKFKASTLKRYKTNSVAFLAKQQKADINPEGQYDLIYTWYKPNNRTDHDNIAFAKKFVNDGLKLAGVIKDDSPKFIRNFKDDFVLDRTRSYISCSVEFIEVRKYLNNN